MDAAAEFGRNPVSKHQIQPGMEMSRLTRDGTAEPVSRDQILRHARGQGNIIFPVQLTTSRIGNLTRLIHTLLYVMTIHTRAQAVVSLRFSPTFDLRPSEKRAGVGGYSHTHTVQSVPPINFDRLHIQTCTRYSEPERKGKQLWLRRSVYLTHLVLR